MPPKGPPKIYQILIRSHKLTVFLTRTPTSTIKELKEDAQSALSSDVVSEKDVPAAKFEVCQLVSRKGSSEYRLLNDSMQIKDCGIGSWEILYLRFYDPDTGELQDVEFTPLPTFDGEEPDSQPESSSSKGKRKASAIDETS
ncbi:hypothetical protein BDZ89DRAFT_1062269 [Hymenopellis radicata]|nr:hypothetical protein BDZ89DRAFT_1062269 [Hymenopellis radicata]